MAFEDRGTPIAEFETILFRQDGGVAVLVLNRPQVLNALALATHKDLFSALAIMRERDDLRVLVITGAGRGFCSGDDMKESDPRDGVIPPEEEVEIVWHDIVREMRALPKPVIAAVNGVAVGAGSGLVLGSDVRIASERGRYGDIFIQRGIAGGAYLLTRAIGPARALELIYTGDIIDADEAYRLGIFNKVVPHDDLEETAMAFAHRLAKGPAEALALSKAAVEAVIGKGLDEGFKIEEAAKLASLKTQDVREGIMSFVDKRDSAFGAE